MFFLSGTDVDKDALYGLSFYILMQYTTIHQSQHLGHTGLHKIFIAKHCQNYNHFADHPAQT